MINIGFGKSENFCKEIFSYRKFKIKRKSSIAIKPMDTVKKKVLGQGSGSVFTKQINEFKLNKEEKENMRVVFTFIMVPFSCYERKVDILNESLKPLEKKRYYYNECINVKELSLTKGDNILITNVINENALLGILYDKESLLKYGFPEKWNEKIDEAIIGGDDGLVPKKDDDDETDEIWKEKYKIPINNEGIYSFHRKFYPADEELLFNEYKLNKNKN